MNEELLKSLNTAIDTAIKELVNIDTLSKGDMNLQDAKLRPESANGTLPGDNREESVLKPEDAHKTEEAAKADDKKDDKDDKKKDDDDDDDMDDEKAEKLKSKIQKYEDKKKKMAPPMAAQGAMMSKADVDQISDTLKKSIVTQVEEMHKSFSDRLSQIESLIGKMATAPQPRQSVSGLAPLAKSNEDVQAAAQQNQMSKSQMIDKLFELQKSNDKRVDSMVISRVEMGDYSVLAERGINLK